MATDKSKDTAEVEETEVFHSVVYTYGSYTSDPIPASVPVEAVQRSLAGSFKEVAQATVKKLKVVDGVKYVEFVKKQGKKGVSQIQLFTGDVVETLARTHVNQAVQAAHKIKEIAAAYGIAEFTDYETCKNLILRAMKLKQITNSDVRDLIEMELNPDHHALASYYARIAASKKSADDVTAYSQLSHAHSLLALTEVIHFLASTINTVLTAEPEEDQPQVDIMPAASVETVDIGSAEVEMEQDNG